jgi:hypothetical protein
MVTKKSEHEMTPVAQQGFVDFTPAEGMRAGIGAGVVLGIVIGGTIWSHAPDVFHLMVALAVILFCMVVGAGIGRLVANISPE